MARKEPTHTITIRKNWGAEFYKRFRTLKGAIRDFLLKDNQISNAYDFGESPARLKEFMAFLQKQIDDKVYDNVRDPEKIWQNKYINQSYYRGIKYARSKIKNEAPKEVLRKIEPAEIEIPKASLVSATVPQEMLKPAHLDALQVIYSRDFTDLEGITDAMSTQISREITTGMSEGQSVWDIADKITKRVDKIGLTRARLMVRTETIRSYNLSAANETERISENAGVEPKYQWLTTLDGREREEHRQWNGQIFTKSEYLARIGDPNCRCSFKPVYDV